LTKEAFKVEKFVTLNNGVKMPAWGYGVWQIDDPKLCERCVMDAVEAGYRLIDTASGYLNEEAVGAGIKTCGLPREELFITTKLWVQDFGYDKTVRAFGRSLKRLGLDYVDLYLIHWPHEGHLESYRAMSDLCREGKIRAIGVSNFHTHHLDELAEVSDIVPAVDQVECHPFFQQQTLRKYLDQKGIVTEAWSPLGHGSDEIFKNSVIAKVARTHGKSPVQIILRWHYEEGIVAIPKSSNRDRIRQNCDIFDFELTQEEITALRTLDTGTRMFWDSDDPELQAMLGTMVVDI